MAKNNKVIQKITDWKVIFGLQVLSSLVLIGFVFKLGAVPMKYTLIIIVVLALLCLLNVLLMKPSKEKGKGKVRNVIGKILSILLSILLLLGSLYIAKGDSTINTITGADEQTSRISVVVLKDSGYEKLSDLKNQTIETCTSEEPDIMKEAIEGLNKAESSIKTKDIDVFTDLADDLYEGKTKAIYLNEAYNGMFEEKHEDYESKTKVIWTYEKTEEVKDISKDVNVTKDPFIVYISGIDTYGKVSTVSRSDVNMIVTVNPKTKQILMTSIPRDYYVTLTNKGKKDKLTHSGLGGINNTVSTVENFMGIDINYYARVNFTSLIKMVDALGGITVNIPKSFTANADGSYFEKGTQTLNGKQALAYSRERYAFGGGDGARVQHQQQVLTAMLKKMMSPAIITSYSSVLKSIDGSFETNMTSKEITSLLQMQINDMASWTFITKQLGGTGKLMTGGAYMPNHNLYYMIPSESSISENKQAIQKVLNGETIE